MEQRDFCGATVGLLFLCCFVALGQGELTLEALPDVLFVDNSGVHNVELGTVIRAYCTASSSSAPVVMWFKNGGRLLNDPPHIRIRSSTDDTEVMSVLTIDNFRVDDNGSYSCEANDSMTTLSSTTLSLTAIEDNSISLLRNPVDFEIRGGDTVLSPPKTYDSISDNRTLYTPGIDFETTPYDGLCCQVFRCIAALPGDQRSAADGMLTVTWLKDGQEIVHSTGRTEIENEFRYQSGQDETRYVSRLFLRIFEVSDAGVYQCVYSDFDTDGELVFSSPFRLDSDGAAVGLVAVSPVDIILDPPEKLVIQVESSGGYFRHAWYKNDEEMLPNGDTLFREPNPDKFSEFFQVFVQDPTITSDQGIYRVDLIDNSSALSVLQTQEFTVTPLVSLNVDALDTTVTVVEGDDVDISCVASANPLPSDIVWSFGGNPTMFAQTDTTENKTAYVVSNGTFSFTEGNKTSTLHITAAEYPTNSGVYTCSSSNDTATVDDTITVEVQVPPELNVSATSTRIAIGQSVNVTCSVSRSVPTENTIEWTFTDTSGTTTTLIEDGELLVITDITEDAFGTYTCNATNTANLSGSANTTIGEGYLPEVSIGDIEVALPGDNITLDCSASGDTPLTFQWTIEGNTDSLNSNTSSGILNLTNISVNDFGVYTCDVSNALGNRASEIELEQGTAPTTSDGRNVSVVEGETLELMVTFESNLVLESITWSKDGDMLESGTDMVTITIVNSDPEPPNATSTLTSISRSSESGSYEVTATNRAGSATTTFDVDVFYPPEVRVSATRTRLLVNGSTALNCSVTSSNPNTFTVMWTLTDTSGTIVTLSDTEQILVVSSIGEDEFGTYTCNVTNTADLSETAEITIELGEIPEVTTDEVDPAVPGDNVTLNCYATGDIPFTYQWTMQGNTTILNDNTSMGTLQLLDIQESQFGTYICTVSNPLGVGASNVTIEQGMAPVTGANESAVFGVGSDLFLVASFFGFNLELDEITWTQNSSMLSDGVGGVSITNSDLNTPEATSTLTRPGITGVSYAGLYVATARNRAGSVSTTFTVVITDAPDIQNGPQDYMFDEGSEGVLTCTVTGIPAVTIYWQLEGENITDGASVTITNNFAISHDVILTTGFLTISSIQRSNAGVYTCVGTNGIRPDVSISHTVTVNFAPEILQDPTAVDVLAPNSVILTCTAEGEPSPDIVWIKETSSMQMEYSESENGVEINTETFTAMSNSTITINPTNQFVTANYSCVAMNELGNATSQPAQVTVFVAPSVIPAQPLYFAIEFQVQELTCIATGVPAPGISFMRGDVILDRIGNMTSGGNLAERVNLREQSQSVLNSDGLYVVNRTLEILSPVGEDTGLYSCTASTEVLNMTLSREATFDLIVEVTPTIEIFPEDTEVISPETAIFSCEASGALPPNITWMRNGTTLESGEDILISIDTGDGIRNSTIRVLDTLPNDATAYTCVATTAAGTVNASAELTVIFPPEIITPALDTVVSVNEGMTAIFECAATGIPGPNITWYNSSVSSEFNEELDSRVSLGVQTPPEPVSTPNGTIFSVSRELTLSDTRDSDSGIYFCQASNGEEESLTVRMPFELFVGVGPVIISTPEDRTELQGNTAVFTCTATARPRPNITWWRYDVNGSRVQLVNEVNKVVVEFSFGEERERTSNLTVLDVQPSDAGMYQCQAENQVSIAEENATLTVHVIPEITFPPPNYRYEINQFMDVILLCTAIGIPAPNIQFFLNNTLLDSQFNDRFSLQDPTTETTDITGRGDNVYLVMRQLLISPALDEDSNNYSCVAANENGNDLVEFELFVSVAPNISDGPDSQAVLLTEAFTLVCVAEGRPTPNITWFQDSSDDSSTEVMEREGLSIITMQRGEREVVSNLTIDSVFLRDAAEYTCNASNVAGSVVQSADITVHVTPEIQFLGPSPLLTVNQSDSAIFECNATGIPAPILQWSMGDIELNILGSGEMAGDLDGRINITESEETYLSPDGSVFSVTSVLTIVSTVSSDSGNYSCIASNRVGESMIFEETTNLFVQVPPLVVAVVPEVIGFENMDATLQFMIDDAEPRVLLSNLRWFYGDNMVDITNQTNRTSLSQLETSFSSDGAYFNITVVNILQRRLEGEETDEGQYSLQATNPAGVSIASINLEVYGRPRIDTRPGDDFVIVGGTSVFACTASAHPAHMVEWTFINSEENSTEIIISTTQGNNTEYRIDNKTGSPTFGQLMIPDVQYSDRGDYMCRAINEVGMDNASASLTVHIPPTVENTSQSMQINISEPATLVCLITGFPIPTVTWWKDGEILSGVFVYTSTTGSGSESGSSDGNIASGLPEMLSIADLLSGTVFSEEDVQGLGELGVVSIAEFNSLERDDTGDYRCVATNSLPGSETGVLMAASSVISLTVLEVPDVATGLASNSFGARWVLLEWTPAFDGNSDILSFQLIVNSENPIAIKTSSTSFNVTDILPFTSYGFQVSLCNAIGCSEFTEMITVMTAQDAPDAAPNITESVSLTSTSIFISWNAPTIDTRNGILTDYVIRYTTNPELPISMWQMTSTTDSRITLNGLSIFTVYNVSVAATTEAGVGPYDTIEIRTQSDTCSGPFGVTFSDVGETTISLTWNEPSIPNGIIDSYMVLYRKEGTDTNNTVMSDTDSVRLVSLEPYTQYIVFVTCVNAAGAGNSSIPMRQRTNSAPPTIPDNAIVDSVEQPGRREFSVVFNKPDESNGPISHYHAVAVKVSADAATLQDPDIDFDSFQSIDNVYSSVCDEVSQNSVYIAAEIGSDKFQASTLQFTFGNDDNTLNDQSRYSNGPLCYSTTYVFFLRVYNDASTNAKRSVRQTSDRQYGRFTSSSYISYKTEAEPSSSDNGGTIAAVVVVLIVVIAVIVAIVVIVGLIIRKRRILVYKTTATEAVDFDTSYYQQNEHVQLTEIRSHEGVTDPVHEPIPVVQFASYVESMHMNENCGFGEQYKSIQERSPKNPVEACIHPDNKQRNRYANIQCFDQSRCFLKSVEGHEHDYINANFINGYNRCNEYIATQGPLPNTVVDFWRLVWDHNVCTIVMLTNLIEKMKVKCSQYWPNADSQTFDDITVTFQSVVTNADFVIRVFSVKREGSDEVRQIYQCHYLSWPDFGVPRHATPLLYFLRRIRDIHRYGNPQPILVHCSAGVGRTGTLITIDVELQRAQKDGMVDPFNFIFQMREQRNQMVQTEAQYIFLHDALLEGMTSRGTEIPVDGLSGRMTDLEQFDQDGETGYQAEFNRLRQFRVNIKEFTVANDSANQFKNRLANALPFNDNRVYLTTMPGVSGSDYVNASYIDGYTRKGAFIATQGPLEETVNDFWRMVAERDIQVIVMLTQLQEKGKEMCARYWPKEPSTTESRGAVSIELLSEETFDDYIHRKIQLNETVKGAMVSRVVHHFQFMTWPENGAPDKGDGMIDLIGQVLRVQQQTGDKPIVVHCSAGIGRTGAFCTLSTAIERVKAEGLIDVFHIVKHLRTQRPHMVQTVEQYMFCYRAIREYVSSLEQYSNFV